MGIEKLLILNYCKISKGKQLLKNTPLLQVGKEKGVFIINSKKI